MNAQTQTAALQTFRQDSGVAPLEVVIAASKENAVVVTRCEERITQLAAQLRQSDRLNAGLRFLIGAQMIVAKNHILHGQFEPWCVKTFQIAERTAQEMMKFSSTWLAVAPKQLKGPQCSLFKQLPERLENGGLSDQESQALMEIVPDVMEGQSIRNFIKANTAREHPNKCEHCAKPVSAAATTCPHCKKTITPKMTAADIAAAEREQAKQFLNNWLGQSAILIEHAKLVTLLTPIERQIFMANNVAVNNRVRGSMPPKQQAALKSLIEYTTSSDELVPKEVKQQLKALKVAAKAKGKK